MSDSAKRRLLITTSTLPVQPGDGRPRFVLDLAQSLAEFFDVMVLAPHVPGAPRAETVGNVLIRRFHYFFPERWQVLASESGIAANLRNGWRFRIQAPFLMIAEVAATLTAIWRFKPHVINAHWLVPQGLSAAVVHAVTGTPLMLHVHAADVYFLQRTRWGSSIARYVVRASRAIYADGSHVRSALDALVGRPSGAQLRPMGVWFEQFGTAGREVGDRISGLIVFVGRLVEKKGLVHLIHALVSVRRRVASAHLRVIGSGPLEQELRAEVRNVGLFDAVEFLGPLPHDEVVKHLHVAEVACVPSIIDRHGETEGMPTVVLEAMASGVKVVGSDVDGIPDVLQDEVNGWLAPPADPTGLSNAIVKALMSTGSGEVALQGVSTATQHDWRVVAEGYAGVLNKVVDRAR